MYYIYRACGAGGKLDDQHTRTGKNGLETYNAPYLSVTYSVKASAFSGSPVEFGLLLVNSFLLLFDERFKPGESVLDICHSVTEGVIGDSHSSSFQGRL